MYSNFRAMRVTKFQSVTFNFEKSEIVRFFTCVYFCTLFALEFSQCYLDSIFDVYAISVSPTGFVRYI